MQYKAEVRYIASIYPGATSWERRSYGPSFQATGRSAARSTLFKLDPVPKGSKPFVLAITDSFQAELDTATGKFTRTSPVPVESIVSDLMNVWTGGLFNVPQGAMPGIMEIAGPTPTPAELAQMNSQQTFFFEYLFTEGERLAREQNWKEISSAMRLAAEWLGHKRSWSHRALARDASPCPACQEIVPNEAWRCAACGTIIRPIPKEFQQLNPDLARA